MTGFTTCVFLSRNRVSPKEAFEGLELCERKLSCTVLRGLDGSNPFRLLGDPSRVVSSAVAGDGEAFNFYPCALPVIGQLPSVIGSDGAHHIEDTTDYIKRVTRPVATSAAAQIKSKLNHALRRIARPNFR